MQEECSHSNSHAPPADESHNKDSLLWIIPRYREMDDASPASPAPPSPTPTSPPSQRYPTSATPRIPPQQTHPSISSSSASKSTKRWGVADGAVSESMQQCVRSKSVKWRTLLWWPQGKRWGVAEEAAVSESVQQYAESKSARVENVAVVATEKTTTVQHLGKKPD